MQRPGMRHHLQGHARLFPRMALLRRGRQERGGPHEVRQPHQPPAKRVVFWMQDPMRPARLL